MFINSYENPNTFLERTSNHPSFIKSAYARYDRGIRSPLKEDLKSLLLGALPISGSIRGLARLYSIYSVKDRSKDSKKDVITHTVIGILEFLGFGALLLVLSIVLTIIGIFFLIAVGTIGLCCQSLKRKLSS
ncbi:hypothetical protein C834K_0597 [Chlamydia poikilotherma]|uniref:Uncharacterized protein n=1 Tax=Chlamydia poikilotherma TaxID=1967783 RepID=A0A3B0PST8_9CHLA|nr:hypothetical protein [Chlamydia poikilotherma]SYX09051.1 hypothetical protein C834K_0597 [Chlamydia poikilotherma]